MKYIIKYGTPIIGAIILFLLWLVYVVFYTIWNFKIKGIIEYPHTWKDIKDYIEGFWDMDNDDYYYY